MLATCSPICPSLQQRPAARCVRAKRFIAQARSQPGAGHGRGTPVTLVAGKSPARAWCTDANFNTTIFEARCRDVACWRKADKTVAGRHVAILRLSRGDIAGARRAWRRGVAERTPRAGNRGHVAGAPEAKSAWTTATLCFTTCDAGCGVSCVIPEPVARLGYALGEVQRIFVGFWVGANPERSNDRICFAMTAGASSLSFLNQNSAQDSAPIMVSRR